MGRRSFLSSSLTGITTLLTSPLTRAAANDPKRGPPAKHAPAPRNLRRVVTGHSSAGRAMVASDSRVEPTTVLLTPELAIHNIWGADQVPAVPDEGLMPAHVSYFPPVNGYRFGLITIPPESTTPAPTVDPQVGAAEMERKLPGLASHFEPDHPGVHRDDGQQVLLKSGDTVIQNGTRHAWHNRSTVPCQMVFCLIGAKHHDAARSTKPT